MKWTRRNFLKRAGWGAAALAGYEAGLALLAERCGRVLAAPGRRKLALLVGINRYPETVADFSVRGTVLNGCLTDVELQRRLLIHRFGFAAADIVTLTDQQATREAIETIFVEHLVKQARAGDAVVFHFSGLGSRVAIADSQQNTLVPVDGTLPVEEDPALRDLPESTLWALVRSLSTSQVLTVVDAGYSETGMPLQGNLRVRSRPNAPMGQSLPAEQQFLAELREQRGRVLQAFSEAIAPIPGLYLSATAPQQLALEGQWDGFSAGLLTYSLTQQLWSSTEAQQIWIPLRQVQRQVRQWVGTVQQPLLVSGGTATFLEPSSSAAEAVVMAVEPESRSVQVWLGGLPAAVLEGYSAGSLLSLPTADLPAPLSLQLRSRDGLTAKAALLSAVSDALPAVGQEVWEQVRLLPRAVGLTVALDSSLERIERVDATSAFATARVSVVAAGEQPADYVFGKVMLPVLSATLPPDLQPAEDGTPASPSPEVSSPSRSRYGLFSPGRGTVPGGILQRERSIKTAVNKLTPQVRSLLAIKLLRQTQNAASSQLGVRVILGQRDSQTSVFWSEQTDRGPWTAPADRRTSQSTEGIPSIPAATPLQFQVLNYSDRPLYGILLGWDGAGRAIALGSTASTPIPPHAPQRLPAQGWQVTGASEATEWFWIFSPAPLQQTIALLNANSAPSGLPPFLLLTDPLAVVQALLQDLNTLSREAELPLPEGVTADLPADAYALDVRQWATLVCLYEG